MKVCLYIRLSEADDDLKCKTESESISNQRELLTQYLKIHGEFHPYEMVEFVDDGFSGTNGNRPGFEKMMEYLRDGQSKLVLCKDLSRFFRDYVEIGDYLERIFPFLGVRFIAVNDGYDSDDYKGTTGGMDVVMKCIVYSYYSRDLSVKIKTVMEAKAKKGQYIGAFPPYGLLRDPEDKHHLVPDPVASKIVRRIFDLALDGKGTGDIARILNADHVETPAAHHKRMYPESNRFKKRVSEYSTWTSINVMEILRRQEYTGAVVSHRRNWKGLDNPQTTVKEQKDWIIVPECHEAIVSTEEFEKAQEVIQSTGRAAKVNKDYPLRSLIYCGCCGRAMQRSRGKHVPIFYYCDKGRYIENTPCPVGEHFYEGVLERRVIQSLSDLLQLIVQEEKSIREAAARMEGTADNLRRGIQQTDQQIKKLSLEKLNAYERYSDGGISRDEFLHIRDLAAAQTQRLEAQKISLEKDLTELRQAESSELKETAAKAEAFLKAENVTNQMLKSFIKRVDVYTGSRIEIRYRFNNPFQSETDGSRDDGCNNS